MICLENLRKLMGIFDHFKGILTGLNINLKTLRTLFLTDFNRFWRIWHKLTLNRSTKINKPSKFQN
jgi:hypothetical protein